MKAIMISIKPKWCAKIMNRIKTIEIRKNKALAKAIQKLIDENGFADIYVYCSKDGYNHLHELYDLSSNKTLGYSIPCYVKGWEDEPEPLNGKIIFKFRCYFVEVLPYYFNEDTVCEKSCLTFVELRNYLKDSRCCAIHISDLEIFDKPKELREFYKVGHYEDLDNWCTDEKQINGKWCIPLKNAPQNFCYVEVE